MTELLTVNEVAALLRLSRNAIYRGIASGRYSELEVVRVGGRVRVTKRSIDRLLGENQ